MALWIIIMAFPTFFRESILSREHLGSPAAMARDTADVAKAKTDPQGALVNNGARTSTKPRKASRCRGTRTKLEKNLQTARSSIDGSGPRSRGRAVEKLAGSQDLKAS